MPNLGAPEILVILLVALIFLGPKRLPEVGRQIGGALRELRKVQTDVRGHIEQALNHEDDDDVPSVPSASSATTTTNESFELDRGRDDGPPPPTASFS